MRLKNWQKVWALSSISIVAVAAAYTTAIVPRKSVILNLWAIETIETIKPPDKHIFEAADDYKHITAMDTINDIHTIYKDNNEYMSRFEKIDSRYQRALNRLPKLQGKAYYRVAMYCSGIIISLYALGWAIDSAVRSNRARKRERTSP